MTSPLRLDEQLGSRVWPEMMAISALALAPGDTLICCAGFEDRSTEVLRVAAARGASLGIKIVAIQYCPPLEENRVELMSTLCARIGATPKFVRYDREDPQGAPDSVFSSTNATGRIYIDISGMSRLLIVQLVSEGLRTGIGHRLTIVYVEAEEYPPSRAEVRARLANAGDPLGIAMFLSSGVFGLTVVPELSSVAQQGQPMRVVAFPSWNTMQMAAVCSELQASSFTVVHGVPPRADNAWRTGAVRTLNRVETLTNPEECYASTLDYRESLRILMRIYGDHGQQEKLVLIPTGSKMQSVAIGIACGWLHDLQVAYPTPRTFTTPARYTKGVRAVFTLDLAAFVPPRRRAAL